MFYAYQHYFVDVALAIRCWCVVAVENEFNLKPHHRSSSHFPYKHNRHTWIYVHLFTYTLASYVNALINRSKDPKKKSSKQIHDERIQKRTAFIISSRISPPHTRCFHVHTAYACQLELEQFVWKKKKRRNNQTNAHRINAKLDKENKIDAVRSSLWFNWLSVLVVYHKIHARLKTFFFAFFQMDV